MQNEFGGVPKGTVRRYSSKALTRANFVLEICKHDDERVPEELEE